MLGAAVFERKIIPVTNRSQQLGGTVDVDTTMLVDPSELPFLSVSAFAFVKDKEQGEQAILRQLPCRG